MTNLRVWIGAADFELLEASVADSFTVNVYVSGKPSMLDDLCYELVPVSREQLAKEADEGIKQIDKEMSVSVTVTLDELKASMGGEKAFIDLMEDQIGEKIKSLDKEK